MPTSETWLALAKRAEDATGPDREIDLSLARIFNAVVLRQRDDDSGADEYTHWKFTSSLDDIIALIEREFPQSAIVTAKGKSRNDEPLYGAIIYDRIFWKGQKELGGGESKIWANALVAAFCRTKAATNNEGER